jgi:uncharacterized protein (TIGR02118 family)
LTTKISIFYPNAKGSRFDMRYYIDTHMPLAVGFLSTHPGYKGVSVDRGISGVEPGSDPTFAAMCHFLFNSAADFMAAFMPNAAKFRGDVPHYTDTRTVIQFSEVLIQP